MRTRASLPHWAWCLVRRLSLLLFDFGCALELAAVGHAERMRTRLRQLNERNELKHVWWQFMAKPNYLVIEDGPDHLLLSDVGPWDRHLTVTNGVEIVVQELVPRLAGRKLEYIDSEGERATILVKDGEFAGFAWK